MEVKEILLVPIYFKDYVVSLSVAMEKCYLDEIRTLYQSFFLWLSKPFVHSPHFNYKS